MVDQSRAHPELVNTLKSSKGFNCGHIIVNGLYHKIDEVRLLLDEAKIHILAVSETHLNRINIHEINYDFELRTTEAILIEAELRSQKLLLACIYRPPNDKHFIIQKNLEMKNMLDYVYQ